MGTLGEGGEIEGEEFLCGWVSDEEQVVRGDRWEGRRW